MKDTYYGAEQVLKHIGQPAVPELINFILHQSNEEILSREIRTLAEIGPGPAGRPFVPQFIQLYQRGNQKDRLLAILLLGSLGATAREAVPLLGEALRQESTAEAAWEALESIGPPAATPIFLAALHDRTLKFREKTFLILAEWEVDPPKVIPALIQILCDPAQGQEIRMASAQALAKYSPCNYNCRASIGRCHVFISF